MTPDIVQSSAPVQRNQNRLTFAPGLQTDVTWSPDGRFVAYASDEKGNFDIWVQSVSGGDPVPVTKSPTRIVNRLGHQRNNQIVFHSERANGSLWVVPALGGSNSPIATFGVRPHWMPDGESVLFASTDAPGSVPKFYTVGLDGRPPRQILQRFTDSLLTAQSWALHPDGRRLSMIATARTSEQGVFTVSLPDGTLVLSKDRMNLRPQQGLAWALTSLVWSPSGTAVYTESMQQWKSDLWRFAVNAESLELVSGDRLTTGAGIHQDPAISPDGKRLAFTTHTQSVRLWSFPLDAATGRIRGEGTAITDASARAMTFDLTHDGRKLAYVLAREGGGREELWLTDFSTKETRLVNVEETRRVGQWSHDGNRLAYEAFRWTDAGKSSGETAVVVQSLDGRGEQPVTTFRKFLASGAGGGWRSVLMIPFDWSLDDQRLLVGSDQFTTPHVLALLAVARRRPTGREGRQAGGLGSQVQLVASETLTERPMDRLHSREPRGSRRGDNRCDPQWRSACRSVEPHHRCSRLGGQAALVA